MASYWEKLKDVRWQKRRLQILERDGWQCTQCGDKGEGSGLAVHHRIYRKGGEPWESHDLELTSVCADCHSGWESVRDFLQELFFANSDLATLRTLHELLSIDSNPSNCADHLVALLRDRLKTENAEALK